MVITNLVGGLGNQMFQLATGMGLAERLNTDLFLDLNEFADYGLRAYELDEVFSIKYKLVSSHERNRFLWHKKPILNNLPSVIINEIHGLQKITYLKEAYSHVDERFFAVNGNVYLWGFWNSQDYFDNIVNKVHEQFTFLPSKNKSVLKFKHLINKTQVPVSVHVRRGDYAHVNKTNKVHGLCSLDYYQQAIMLMRMLVTKPRFFIFSDDLAWCKQNLKIPRAIFIEHNGKNYDDLRLMSECKHHIIANSTFSWWGAWLNKNADKQVIAPKPWFDSVRLSDKDICPRPWIALKK